ncbi:Hypothetical protein PBC10988_4750 [Planctomycetales bacterium 10988]|nr:Hypothetical protein PBC10988_4750 [Planctomycetales bacterium 10988]
MLCRLFGVSRAGFYRWLRRKPSQRKLHRERIARQIQSVHQEVSPDDGSPRMQRELVERGRPLLRQHGGQGDAGGWLAGSDQAGPSSNDNGIGAGWGGCPEPSQAAFYRGKAESGVADGPGLRADAGGFQLSLHGGGFVLTPHRRLGERPRSQLFK